MDLQQILLQTLLDQHKLDTADKRSIEQNMFKIFDKCDYIVRKVDVIERKIESLTAAIARTEQLAGDAVYAVKGIVRRMEEKEAKESAPKKRRAKRRTTNVRGK